MMKDLTESGIPFKIVQKKWKHLYKNLKEYVQNLWAAHYKKITMTFIKYLNKWRDLFVLWIGRLDIVKMPT